jgi:hypothetical protein
VSLILVGFGGVIKLARSATERVHGGGPLDRCCRWRFVLAVVLLFAVARRPPTGTSSQFTGIVVGVVVEVEATVDEEDDFAAAVRVALLPPLLPLVTARLPVVTLVLPLVVVGVERLDAADVRPAPRDVRIAHPCLASDRMINESSIKR